MTTACPTDGPATVFQADPLTTTNEDVFGLVLVAAWPPPEALMDAYRNVILPQLRSCFDEDDYTEPTSALYLYPPECLHVTIATTHSISVGTKDPQQRNTLMRCWKMVVDGATRRSEWPKTTECMELSLKSSQIGEKAAILLWTETTGTIDTMRTCIAEEAASRRAALEEAGVSVDTLHIPNIVHSTVLRYRRVPQTSGQVVQERFRTTAQNEILRSFPNKITIPCSVKLVCERVPYMNVPNDADHILSSWSTK